MAYEIIRPNFQLPVRPASILVPRTPVKLVGSAGAVACVQIASTNDRPFGLLGEATSGTPIGDAQDALLVIPGDIREEGNIVKAIAGASLGAGAEVGFATLGVCSAVQGGSYVATVPQLGPVSGASGSVVWSVGEALESAAAGSLFTLYIKPRQLSGLS